MMEFKVSDLEQEPIEFDVQLPIGTIDFGEEATQDGPMATPGRAEVIHEHRGPREIVADIRLKGRFSGQFEVPCARCIEPVEIPLAAEFDLIFRPIGARMPRRRNAPLQRPRLKSVIIKETVFCLRMRCASRCFCPCPSERYARMTAKGFARAAARTATSRHAPATRLLRMLGGKRWQGSGAG